MRCRWTVDDPESRVDIVATAAADLKGIARLMKGFATGAIPVQMVAAQLGWRSAGPRSLLRQGARFTAVGVASTIAYLLLFIALRHTTGAQTANLLALLLTAVANTAANRRFTFGVRGGARVARHQVEGLVVFGIALAVTSGSLAVLHLVVAQPHHAIELIVLVIANLAATAIRFVLLRGWVFHPHRTH